MRRWLPLLLAAMLALGCAGCTKRQTVTVYRIETGGTALLHPETVTVPGGTDPVQVALDALGAKPGDSTCTNPVRDWLTIDGSMAVMAWGSSTLVSVFVRVRPMAIPASRCPLGNECTPLRTSSAMTEPL